jgi:hypothetical protein
LKEVGLEERHVHGQLKVALFQEDLSQQIKQAQLVVKILTPRLSL